MAGARGWLTRVGAHVDGDTVRRRHRPGHDRRRDRWLPARLVTRAWSWLGLGVGLVIATRLAGPAVDLVDDQEAFVRLLTALAVVVVCAGIGQAIGFAIGDRLRRSLPESLVGVDRVAGAVSGLLVVVVVVWLLLPTLTMMQGTLARLARGSVIVAAVDRYSPPVPPSVRDLGQQVSDFGFPEVFDDLRAAPEVGPPPESLGLPVEVVDGVRPSTMNIEGRGCGGIREGSGFVVDAELVATNAHVVAGTESLEVVLDDGSSRLAAELVAIDTSTDLALLRVPGTHPPSAYLSAPPRTAPRQRCSATPAGRISSGSRQPWSPTTRRPWPRHLRPERGQPRHPHSGRRGPPGRLGQCRGRPVGRGGPACSSPSPPIEPPQPTPSTPTSSAGSSTPPAAPSISSGACS